MTKNEVPTTVAPRPMLRLVARRWPGTILAAAVLLLGLGTSWLLHQGTQTGSCCPIVDARAYREPGGEILGRVWRSMDANTTYSNPPDQPLSATVYYTQLTDCPNEGCASGQVSTNQYGEYTTPQLPYGDYQLQALITQLYTLQTGTNPRTVTLDASSLPDQNFIYH